MATSDACEAVVHAASLVTHSLGHENYHGLLQVDVQNAFNLISRKVLLKQTRVHFPDLYKWVAYCYDTKPLNIWVGKKTLRIAT